MCVYTSMTRFHSATQVHNLPSESISYLLIVGAVLFLLSGSFRGILGFMMIAAAVSLTLIYKGIIYIALILLASLVGLVMLLMLLEHSAINITTDHGNQVPDIVAASCLIAQVACQHTIQLHFQTYEVLRLAILFETALGLLLLSVLVFVATLCCVHIAIKPNNHNIQRLIDLWAEDFCILAVIASILCTLPALIRLAFQANAGETTQANWIEQVYRWSSDVYEVGISVPGSSLPSILYGKNSDNETGSYRFLPYLFLFLLLDLESAIVIPMILGTTHAFLPLVFIACLLFSLACELTTL